jgi:hypothetical protein
VRLYCFPIDDDTHGQNQPPKLARQSQRGTGAKELPLSSPCDSPQLKEDAPPLGKDARYKLYEPPLKRERMVANKQPTACSKLDMPPNFFVQNFTRDPWGHFRRIETAGDESASLLISAGS